MRVRLHRNYLWTMGMGNKQLVASANNFFLVHFKILRQ